MRVTYDVDKISFGILKVLEIGYLGIDPIHISAIGIKIGATILAISYGWWPIQNC